MSTYVVFLHIQSCGLCPGQTPHPSNDKCHDTASNCREAAKKNLCHKHGKKCKKVKIYIDRSYVVYQCRNVVLLFLHIQSCGLCSGQTPHPSNDKCRDTASNCREVARKNLCHQHGKKCKKVKVYYTYILIFSRCFNFRAVKVISWKFSQYYMESSAYLKSQQALRTRSCVVRIFQKGTQAVS